MNLGRFTSKSCTKKRDVQSWFFANLNLLLFCRSLGRRCRAIYNDDNTALQRCSNVVTIRNNVATMLQRCDALKIVVANRLHGVRCNISFKATTTMSTTTTKKCLMSKTITFFKTSTTRLLDVKPPDTTSNGGHGHTTKHFRFYL